MAVHNPTMVNIKPPNSLPPWLSPTLYPFQSCFHPMGKHYCHYIDEGEGEPVVMLHGNPTWSFYYRELVKSLRKRFRMVAIDNMGCGLSDKPQEYDYSLESHIHNAESIVNSLELRNITLVGHDWGGAIAMGLACRNPDNVKRIVLMNTGAFVMRHIPIPISICRIPVLGQFLVRRLNVFCLAAQSMTTVRKLPRDVRSAYLGPYDSYESRVAIHRFVEDIPMSPEHPSYETLVGIESGLWMFRKVPVCLVWGMRDWVFTGDFIEKWKEFLPMARVLKFPDAGHWVLEDQPAKCVSYIEDFLLEPSQNEA